MPAVSGTVVGDAGGVGVVEVEPFGTHHLPTPPHVPVPHVVPARTTLRLVALLRIKVLEHDVRLPREVEVHEDVEGDRVARAWRDAVPTVHHRHFVVLTEAKGRAGSDGVGDGWGPDELAGVATSQRCHHLHDVVRLGRVEERSYRVLVLADPADPPLPDLRDVVAQRAEAVGVHRSAAVLHGCVRHDVVVDQYVPAQVEDSLVAPVLRTDVDHLDPPVVVIAVHVYA